MESTSAIYASPGAYYDQQQQSSSNITGSIPIHDSNLRSINQDWESYDENLMPARKSKVHFKIIVTYFIFFMPSPRPLGQPLNQSDHQRCLETVENFLQRYKNANFPVSLSFNVFQEFLHRYVLVQAIEKAKSGHYVKKSRVRHTCMFY